MFMLSLSDLIAVISLCVTIYNIGYAHGKHAANKKAQK
jgi:hypothetical protein